MSDLLVTQSDVLTHLAATDSAVATLGTALDACTKLSDIQHTAWLNFRSEYTAFSVAKRKKWSGTLATSLVLLNPAVSELDLRADDAKILDYEHQIAGWQSIAKSTCGLNTPGLTPRDDPSTPGAQLSKTAEHIAIAGAVIVVGVVGLVGFSYVRKFFP
jgi:hypothetical protein